jgi:hypothetical protein
LSVRCPRHARKLLAMASDGKSTDAAVVVTGLRIHNVRAARHRILRLPDSVDKLYLLHGLETLALRRAHLRSDTTGHAMHRGVAPRLRADMWLIADRLQNAGHEVPPAVNSDQNVRRVLAEPDLVKALSQPERTLDEQTLGSARGRYFFPGL